MPVFAGGSAGLAKLFGPTGGYLLGFLLSAYIVGYLADKGWDKSYSKTLIAMIFGTAIIFMAGLTQLSFFVPANSLIAMGFTPFLPGAILKIAIASLILPTVWKFVRK